MEAFSFCSGLTSITIPDSVTSIGSDAFYKCTGLTSVTIPDSVTSIGSFAFYGCTELTSVTIGNSVTSIGVCAFSGCSGLTSITIPDSVTSIGETAFHGTAWYNNQPDGLVYAGKVAYSYKGTCPASVTIKDGTLGIADRAFNNCTELISITIGNSVTSIGNYAFHSCTGLTSINIPDSVTSIGDSAFSDCSGLTSITIPDSVTLIGQYAFSDCSGLTSVTIPDSVTSIGIGAFYDCSGLTSITIGNSVTSIGYNAFSNCSGLKTVIYCGTEYQWVKISIGGNNGPLTSANRSYHLYEDWHISLEPNCTQSGVEYSACTICGNKVTRTVNSLGHSFTNYISDGNATCTADGTKTAKCDHCEVTNTITDVGSKLGHDYVNTVDNKYLKTAADCTHAAVYYKSCSRCGNKSIETFESGEPLGHDYNAVVTAPTHTTQGYTTHTCSRCSDNYKDNYTYMPCGENCGFIIKSNTLYIYGSGDTDNYKTQASVPWYEYADNITEIIIDEGITKIGNYAFYCLGNVKSIVCKNSNLDLGKYVINDSNAGIAVFAENGGSLETYCSENSINYIDPTITPELENVTANSITVKAVEGYEYSKDGAAWQKSNTFTGLSPASEYNIYARYTATADMFDTLGAPLVVTTLKSTVTAPAAPDYQSHTDNSITLVPNDLYEYSIDGENWQESSEFTGLSKNTIYRFYQRVAETETEYVSAASKPLIIAIPDKPQIVKTTTEKITVKRVEGFEYCLDDMVWQDSNIFDKLIDNEEYTVYQRLKAVDGEKVYQITSDPTVALTVVSGAVPGDINGDCEVDNKDLIRLFQYLSEWGVEVNEAALDINGDQAVDNKDLIRLFQYLSEWNVAIF